MSDFQFTRHGKEFRLFGKIDEFTDFSKLFETADQEELNLDLAGIRSINSCGVRSWVDHVSCYDGFIIYKNCSVPMIEQFNMVPEALGKSAWVESFYALFYCPEYDEEDFILINTKEDVDVEKMELKTEFTSSSGAEMEPDFDIEDYFGFMADLVDPADHLPSNSEDDDRDLTQKTRKPLFTKVYLPNSRFEYHGTPHTMFSENISEDGMFVCSHLKFNLGDRFKVDFTIPEGDSSIKLTTEVEIRWIREANPGQNVLPGVGVQFLDLDDAQKVQIREYVSSFAEAEKA